MTSVCYFKMRFFEFVYGLITFYRKYKLSYFSIPALISGLHKMLQTLDLSFYFRFRYSRGSPCHFVKSGRIRSFPGPYFPAFGLNTEIYSVNVRIQSVCGEITTRKNPNADTFYSLREVISF